MDVFKFIAGRPCCADRMWNIRRPDYAFRLDDVAGLRASKLKRAMGGMNGNGTYGTTTLIRP